MGNVQIFKGQNEFIQNLKTTTESPVGNVQIFKGQNESNQNVKLMWSLPRVTFKLINTHKNQVLRRFLGRNWAEWHLRQFVARRLKRA